jgi:hypothetical protein
MQPSPQFILFFCNYFSLLQILLKILSLLSSDKSIGASLFIEPIFNKQDSLALILLDANFMACKSK